MKVLSIFGTRPEAIKMAPVIRALERDERFESRVCVTGQHRQMLNDVMKVFSLGADYDLELMKNNQSLSDIVTGTMLGLDPILVDFKPDVVLVQGDTASAMAASLAAFFRKVEVGHIEAGLRTGNLRSPWPEEANRRLTGVVASRHYAPTQRAVDALLAERVPADSIKLTGNTVIDALGYMIERVSVSGPEREELDAEFGWLDPSRRLILVTGHRRESFGDGFRNICLALKDIAARSDVEVVYPVHLNPNVQAPVREILSGVDNVHLIEPLDYRRFVYLMHRCHFALTDSGGIQEEAPAIRKPVLIMRDTSERMEAVDAGVARLVTTNRASIVSNANELLDDSVVFAAMSSGASPFGDGRAAERIIEDLAA
ncbi:UDP-N-acetylglucosamine 2-epimerase [Bradyrhizobium sp. LB7.2]